MDYTPADDTLEEGPLDTQDEFYPFSAVEHSTAYSQDPNLSSTAGQDNSLAGTGQDDSIQPGVISAYDGGPSSFNRRGDPWHYNQYMSVSDYWQNMPQDGADEACVNPSDLSLEPALDTDGEAPEINSKAIKQQTTPYGSLCATHPVGSEVPRGNSFAMRTGKGWLMSQCGRSQKCVTSLIKAGALDETDQKIIQDERRKMNAERKAEKERKAGQTRK
ncbi:hypothetical protein B9479_001955 [Cryptococcus floricola]|uniref:Uncharacterized protein n=1 Tax=Cryptococcus floricola TaxID=2591691 RepID=A0A5D3B191_9TREE|nr:hypothetical protein B9479_001955 [Cryptococcus floricola]